MLKRIYIDNFRCFVNFEYKPERKQLLLGANGSGKSSLRDAVRLLKEFITGKGMPFTQSSLTRWQDHPLQVFEIEVLLNERLYLYRVEFRYLSKATLPSVNLERLSVDGKPVLEILDGVATNYQGNQSRIGIEWQLGIKNSSVLNLLGGTSEEIREFLGWVSNKLFSLRINPAEMDEIATREARSPYEDFANIASYYRYLIQNDTEGNLGLTTDLKEVLDSFQTLQFKDSDAGRRLIARFGSSSTSINFGLNELSDGQRSLIALYMILHFLIAKGHTIFLDEPDNFISLREIQPWLLAAEDAVEESKGQLILISHHPEILNYWAREYGLLFSREENGHVRTKPYREVADTGLAPAETIARGWEDE
jgi:ATPase subunit of ABC transporter with duplicated ATPase domains